MINVLLDSYLKNDIAKIIFYQNKEIIDELIKADLIGRNGATPSRNLKDIIERKGDFKAIMNKVALCVFEVRNSLFHRGEVLSLINGCNSLMRDLVNKTLEAFLERTNA